MWLIIWPMNNLETAQHATRDDPGAASSDVIVVVAAVASLGAVGLLLLGGGGTGGKVTEAVLSVSSVALAWSVVHTVFTTRYARLYYSGVQGGVDTALRHALLSYLFGVVIIATMINLVAGLSK